MKHTQVTVGTVYDGATGAYVVTEATHYRAFTSVALKPSGHAGVGFSTTVTDLDGPRAYAWKVFLGKS